MNLLSPPWVLKKKKNSFLNVKMLFFLNMNSHTLTAKNLQPKPQGKRKKHNPRLTNHHRSERVMGDF
jgi:hypothetical protein